MFIYELQAALIPELIEYFKQFKAYGTMARRIEEFRSLCLRVQGRVIAKSKDIARAFVEGFVSGFVANIITILINTFASTAQNMVKMIN
ncbi:hypothetical protein [Paenibacillus peoriae]|uniref:hypothetical protein n=1 Tax=Paenibacillus peoriae TaxID=59893 RepID=UPI00215A23B4|nr:hypothetical protein [Paenibacillus peoriae]